MLSERARSLKQNHLRIIITTTTTTARHHCPPCRNARGNYRRRRRRPLHPLDHRLTRPQSSPQSFRVWSRTTQYRTSTLSSSAPSGRYARPVRSQATTSTRCTTPKRTQTAVLSAQRTFPPSAFCICTSKRTARSPTPRTARIADPQPPDDPLSQIKFERGERIVGAPRTAHLRSSLTACSLGALLTGAIACAEPRSRGNAI